MDVHEFNFGIDEKVRFSDVDSLGHVNNAVYLSYFEESRIRYLENLLGPTRGDASSLRIIVLEIRCTYKIPAYYGESIRIHSRVSWMRNKSMQMDYLITNPADGQTIAEGSSILVGYDYDRGQSIELPDILRSSIAAFERIPPRS